MLMLQMNYYKISGYDQYHDNDIMMILSYSNKYYRHLGQVFLY